MSAEYAEEDLPEETIVVNGRSWQREHFDTDGYQWIRELDDSEYDWDRSEVDLVGTDYLFKSFLSSIEVLSGTSKLLKPQAPNITDLVSRN
jgi:hypothetical protein